MATQAFRQQQAQYSSSSSSGGGGGNSTKTSKTAAPTTPRSRRNGGGGHVSDDNTPRSAFRSFPPQQQASSSSSRRRPAAPMLGGAPVLQWTPTGARQAKAAHEEARLRKTHSVSPPHTHSGGGNAVPSSKGGGRSFAGAKWTESPAPVHLPLPPKDWLDMLHSLSLDQVDAQLTDNDAKNATTTGKSGNKSNITKQLLARPVYDASVAATLPPPPPPTANSKESQNAATGGGKRVRSKTECLPTVPDEHHADLQETATVAHQSTPRHITPLQLIAAIAAVS